MDNITPIPILRVTRPYITGEKPGNIVSLVRPKYVVNKTKRKREHEIDVEPTHYMYGGLYGCGVIALPSEMRKSLLEAIVRDYEDGNFATLTENTVDEPFRAYFDIDGELNYEPTDKDVEPILVSVFRAAEKLWPARSPIDNIATVMSSGVKNQRGKFKFGLHIVFETLMVDLTRMRCLFAEAHADFKRTLPGSPLANAFDPAVYRAGRGLRMPWQLKGGKCQCGGGCGMCSHNRPVLYTEASMYIPTVKARLEHGADGSKLALSPVARKPCANLLSTLTLNPCTVAELSEGYAPPEGASAVTVFNSAPRTSRAKSIKYGDDYVDDAQFFSLLVKQLRKLPSGAPGRKYADSAFSKIVTKRTHIEVRLTGENSKFCVKKGGEHAQAGAKLLVFLSSGTIKQSCWGKCSNSDGGKPDVELCKLDADVRDAIRYADDHPAPLFRRSTKIFRTTDADGAGAAVVTYEDDY